MGTVFCLLTALWSNHTTLWLDVESLITKQHAGNSCMLVVIGAA